MESGNSTANTTSYSPDTPVNRLPSDDPYQTPGALVYSILSTLSLFLSIVLAIVYGRLNYNRVFAYFCVSMASLFLPQVLGAWIYGANLSRASTTVCWIQGLWINAAGIAAGLMVLIYSLEIYRTVVWRAPDDEYKRRKYYIALGVLFPVLVGFIPTALVADKPMGILPGPYFCILYKPFIAIAFVSVEGWNTLFCIPGIYFSFRTAIEVARIIYTRKGFDGSASVKSTQSRRLSATQTDIESAFTIPTPSTTIHSPTSTAHQQNASISTSNTFSSFRNPGSRPPLPERSSSKLSTRTIASIPVYVCIRLVLFALVYCAVSVSIYGRQLVRAIQEVEFDFKPTYLEYLIASVGIVIWLIFGTSIEAFKAYWRFLKAVASCTWIRRWFTRDESFGDWEIQRQKEMEKREKEKKKGLKHSRDDSRAKVLNQVIEEEEIEEEEIGMAI